MAMGASLPVADTFGSPESATSMLRRPTGAGSVATGLSSEMACSNELTVPVWKRHE
jgi:hypothetical protein